MTSERAMARGKPEGTPRPFQWRGWGRGLAGRWPAGRIGLALAALGVLALNVALHTIRLAAAPGWDPQEGYNLDIAWNLLHGRLRLFALTSAFGQHPPLFYLLLAALIHLFGYSIVTLRALVALYALLTCAVLLDLGRRAVGVGPALWAGVVFTVAPTFLANTRWGYSYSQLMFVAVLCLWALWRFLETGGTRWCVLAALLAALGVLSDYEGVALIALVVVVVWSRAGRGMAARAAALAAAPPLLGLLLGVIASPGVFGADLLDTFHRASGGSPALALVLALVNYYRLVTLDVWIALGVFGLFLVGAGRARLLLWLYAALMGAVVVWVRALGPSLHTAVPLLPPLALGAGLAIHLGVRRLFAWVAGDLPPRSPSLAGMGKMGTGDPPVTRLGESSAGEGPSPRRGGTGGKAVRPRALLAAAVLFVVIASPLAVALAGDAAGLASTFPTRNDAAIATAPAEAQAAARFVLAHARPGDLTLGSPQVVWLLDQPEGAGGGTRPIYGADLLQAVAYQGHAAAFYPAGLPRGRWAYDVSLARARYVIVDDLIRRLAAPDQVPGLIPLLGTVGAWPVVYHHGEYTIYQRP
ncbi:MAG TPA: glycosyltransferase family 39 protein [Ktedonobacterales bacterium]|nr:glycosyltransferase family 39 protein [Ktedonobacterales bacterium]